MSFWRGLLAARSHLAFVAGLLLAFGVKRAVDHTLSQPPPIEELQATLPLRPPGALTPGQKLLARDAWRYLARNTRESGLVDSVEGFPSTTLWDQGSALMGMVAAQELAIIDTAELEARAGKLIAAFRRAPLVGDALPNRNYDTRTVLPVDANGQPLPEGTGGWSALDLGRLGVPLSALLWRSPRLAPEVRGLLAHWKLDWAAQDGELSGGDLREGKVIRQQEGRLGYEQYAAQSLALFGLDVSRARALPRHLKIIRTGGQELPDDDRAPAEHGGVRTPVLSEPWVLYGLEFGLDAEVRPLAEAVFRAQEARFRKTQILTAVSEDNLDRAPYFVWSTLFEGGVSFRVYDTAGVEQPSSRTLSTKAALGWAALFEGPYADALEDAAEAARAEGNGLFSGRYEEDGSWNRAMTANTCGIALEALAYRVHGPLLRAARLP